MSSTDSSIQQEKGPGLLYVNSKIIDPATLSVDAYTAWYNDIHIPDIFKEKGISSAFRYQAINAEKVERPYLALYPVENLDYLNSDSFKSIPVTDKSLPGSGAIFDLA